MVDFEMMENKDGANKDGVLSIPVRAGKRTYFFDVKVTRNDEYYLTITESKKRFSNEQGKFTYEKHKLFLYKEDFEKFNNAFADAIKFIETGEKPDMTKYSFERDNQDKNSDVNFEDLDAKE